MGGSKHEYHFIHHALPHARTKRSVRHVRLLKTDPHIEHAFQQSGFKREKRYGVPRNDRGGSLNLDFNDLIQPDNDYLVQLPQEEDADARSPWLDLREALDQDQTLRDQKPGTI